MTREDKEREAKFPFGGVPKGTPKGGQGTHLEAEAAARKKPHSLHPMSPNRADTYQGLYIPTWLLTHGLSAQALVTWAAMARLAGRARRLRDTTHARIAAITGVPLGETRLAVAELENADIIQILRLPGKASAYAFRGPRAGDLPWARNLELRDAGGNPSWRPW